MTHPDDDAPLSSVSRVPATEGTLELLQAAGIQVHELKAVTEQGAQLLLALRGVAERAEIDAPDCFRKGFDPMSRLCGGCVWMPRCWSSSWDYLRAVAVGTAQAPIGVPSDIVADRIAAIPGGSALPPPPPPPIFGGKR